MSYYRRNGRRSCRDCRKSRDDRRWGYGCRSSYGCRHDWGYGRSIWRQGEDSNGGNNE